MSNNISSLIKTCYDPATAEEISALEKSIGFTFPDQLKAIWLLGDESHIGPVACYATSDQHFDFHAVTKAHSEWYGTDVGSAYRDYFRDDFPKIVPIGGEGNGDSLCLDYRQSASAPAVLKHDHEIGYRTDFPFYFLARDFDEFIDRANADRFGHYRASDEELQIGDIDALSPETGALSAEQRTRQY